MGQHWADARDTAKQLQWATDRAGASGEEAITFAADATYSTVHAYMIYVYIEFTLPQGHCIMVEAWRAQRLCQGDGSGGWWGLWEGLVRGGRGHGVCRVSKSGVPPLLLTPCYTPVAQNVSHDISIYLYQNSDMMSLTGWIP